MTSQSFTNALTTNDEYSDLETLTGITFTAGNTYTMQIQNSAYLKINDAVFNVSNREICYLANGTDEILFRTPNSFMCTLTILETEAAS